MPVGRGIRVWIPGSRWIGGQWGLLRSDLPNSVGFGLEGTLAEPLTVRGVRIPAGSRVVVDSDSDDLTFHPSAPIDVRGLSVPVGASLTFPGRVLGFPGLMVTALFLVILPLVWIRARREANRFRVCALNEPAVIGAHHLPPRSSWVLEPDGRLTLEFQLP